MLPQLLAAALLASFVHTNVDRKESPPELPAYAQLAEPRAPVRIVYEGTCAVEGHLAKPHDVTEYGTQLTVLDGGARGARLDWATWRKSRPEQRDVETTLVVGTRVLHRDDATQPFREVVGRPAALLRTRLEAAAPWRTLARVRAAPERCTAVDALGFLWTESAADGGGARRFVNEQATDHLDAIVRAFAHPRLGDVRDEVDFGGWSERDGVTLPERLTLRELEGDDASTSVPLTFDVRLASCESGVAIGKELDVPVDVRPAATPRPDVATAALDVAELEPGLTVFTLKDLEARTFVVEFADHLVALGAPISSRVGERIVAAIHERFSAKPLRYVLAGHFHPHYTGGLRAFLAAGAKVVAPRAQAAFAAEIAARPFALEPDAWARNPAKVEIEVFEGTRTFEDATRALTVFDIGANSKHTDEYLVFHLPRSRTLVQEDIGWRADADGTLQFGPRSRGLYDAIVERKLDVATMWQSWPITNGRPSITFAELEAGVKAAR